MNTTATAADRAVAADAPPFWLLVALLLASQTLGSMATTTLPAVAPEVARGLGVSSRLIGVQISILAAAMLVSLSCGGSLSQRYGGCRVTQIGLVLVAAGSAACAWASLWSLAGGTVLMGLGYGLMTPSASHVLMRFTPPDRRNVVFSVKQTGVPLGAVIAASVQPAVAVHVGWQYALLLNVIGLLAVAMALSRGRRHWDDDRDPHASALRNPFAGLGIVWGNAALRYMSLAGAMLVMVQIGVSTFTVVMFVEELGYSLVAAGFVLTVSQVGGVVGRIAWGWVADRTGRCLGTLAALCAVMAVATAACALLEADWHLAPVFGLFFLLGSTASGWNGAYLAEVARLSPPGLVSTATGGSLVVVNAGKLVGPLLIAQAQAAAGAYTVAFALLALPSAIAVACLVTSAHRAPPVPADAGRARG